MKYSKQKAAILAGVVLAGVVITGGFSAAAAGGSEDDPLVTLSYLTQVVTPQLMDEVDKQVAANEQALLDELNAAIDTYEQQMQAALGQGGGSATGSSFAVVTAQAGQVLTPGVGCELLLRTGGATVSAAESPALLDTTAGGSLESGGALVANHLYLTPGDGRSVTFTTDGSFLIRGSYTLE